MHNGGPIDDCQGVGVESKAKILMASHVLAFSFLYFGRVVGDTCQQINRLILGPTRGAPPAGGDQPPPYLPSPFFFFRFRKQTQGRRGKKTKVQRRHGPFNWYENVRLHRSLTSSFLSSFLLFSSSSSSAPQPRPWCHRNFFEGLDLVQGARAVQSTFVPCPPHKREIFELPI